MRENSEHPLSYGQRALWFLHRLAPESAAYNVFFAMRVLSDLHVPALRRAFQTLIDRHPALRTTYVTRDGRPVQLVHEFKEVSFEVLDASHWSREDLDERLVSEAQKPFDLEHGPLFRVTLFTRTTGQHVLLLTAHHIALDLWSLVLLMNELRLMRPAFGEGDEADEGTGGLPPAQDGLKYTEYVRWQDEMLSGPKGERLWSYWRERLGGEVPPLKLQIDRARPPVQTYRGASKTFKLDQELTERLAATAKAERATLYMILLAAFQVLLYRYTEQEEILVGSLASGRSRAEFKSIVGYFVNPLVMRADLAGNPSFSEFLNQVRQTVLAALKRQDYPFPLLIERLQPGRDASRSPLFQVMFLLQRLHRLEDHNVPMFVIGEAGARMELAGHEVESFALQERVAQFELELIMVEAEGALSGVLRYNTDLFEAATSERLVVNFQTLLKSLVDNPAQRVADLRLLTDAEERQLLFEWNNTRADYPQDKLVQHLFEAQVEKSPDAIALTFQDEQLTYGELNMRANELACYLREIGVGPETLVGIYMERSALMVVSMLGILKAGGAYLPLDTASPKERLAYMLGETGPRAILTEEKLRGELPETDASVICLERDWSSIARASVGNPQSHVTADNLAYVIFTSGSTGRPKGVMVCHRNLANFIAGMNLCLGDEPPGVWLALTNISFDISILELLWTLTKGFHVVVQGEQEESVYAVEAVDELASKKLDFSLFYFASDDGIDAAEKYRLLLEGARFADQHGFSAVWTPERHFHAFGGIYPNPSVTSAAIATITERIGIRAGSVVLPLHNPIRVAEEWSVVDNLSKGRAAIAFASGWHANDFVFAPENYASRKQVMSDGIENVRKLWRGESLVVQGGAGNELEVKLFPRPIQRELPVWITTAGSADTFRLAGEIGANVLTHLLGQSFDELTEKISAYREAWRRSGFGEKGGHVTLMLHTFVEKDEVLVRDKVYEPFCNYLRSSLGLWRSLAQSLGTDVDSADFTESDMQELLARAFERYFETSGLFGTPESCLRMVRRLKTMGVDEVACLVDFGVDVDSVISSLRYLDQLRERSNRTTATRDYSLPAQIKRHQVTHLQCTPSLASMLLMSPQTRAALGSLRKLMLGGEALPASLASELGTIVLGETRNMYGPTETTIWSTMDTLDQSEKSVSIGRPIANTEIFILDKNLRPLPVGVPGELHIGGDGLARGYQNHPELTAEKFIPNPFGARIGARLYKTGDLARYLPDGRIEYLGRLDQQVKIRGHRIEPGEIEAVLAEHPSVQEAVLVAREDVPGEVRLVAYVLARDGMNNGELRGFLRQRLPEYMMPAAFVMMDAMPLLPSGKLNRKALPVPSSLRPEMPSQYVAPQSEMERIIASVWQEALGLERVGAQDNFFDLGGHSLLMAQVHTKLRELLRTDVPVIELFKYPTISSLAKYFSQAQDARPSFQQTDDRVRKRKEAIQRRRQLTKGI
jgi:natural product biosynthesis luciferase-like monooxygenase protein